MTVSGIGGLGPGILPGAREAAAEPSESEQTQGFHVDLGNPERSPDQAAFEAGDLPARPPAGTDPEVWALLTDDERAFFEAPGVTGPVTYARNAMDAALAALGAQLDVRG